VKVKKPEVNRERLVVLGKYLDDALTLANMTQSELARRAGLNSSSYLSRAMKGERDVDRATLLSWCAILNCPDWLEERILNAAGFASEQQRKAVERQEVLEETHLLILQEIAKRKEEHPNQ
jgi:transcriptional regulator with XRE-family HTH domain